MKFTIGIYLGFIVSALAHGAELRMNGNICEFETAELKGRIGEGRFIGVNQLVHKPSGTKISGDKPMNRHGLLTSYRVFTRNQRYGEAAYAWGDGEISIIDGAVVMRWPTTEARPFEMRATYSFPKPNEVQLQVSVDAGKELVDFEVQVGSYFDEGFPKGQFWLADKNPVTAPKQLGAWQAFPRDNRAIAIIRDGRWQQGISPVTMAIRGPFLAPVSMRRHADGKLAAVLRASAEDSFALYTAHDGEAHFSNYHALFGRTIPAGTTATAAVTLTVGEWTDGEIISTKP